MSPPTTSGTIEGSDDGTASPAAAAPTVAPLPHQALWVGGILIVCALTWHEGLMQLVGDWRRFPAYHHGFVVPPVVALLIYWGRTHLPPGPPWRAAALVALAASALYALGGIVDAGRLQVLAIAFVAMAVPAMVLGRRFAIRHRFALLFLLAMVPVGASLVSIVKGMTDHGLSFVLAGVDVEGDAGKATAGLRFLLAILAASVLFAHLLFRTRWKQVVFVTAGFLVPVASTILCAVVTALLLQSTELTLAEGFGHFAYGWAFFAVVVATMTAMALLFSEPNAPQRPVPSARQDGSIAPRWLVASVPAAIVLAGIIA